MGRRPGSRRMAGVGVVVFALVVVGASAASFAGQARHGGVDNELLGAHAWGEPRESVRGGVYEPLQAVPGGPYTIERGSKVTLDGSGSRPKDRVTSWTWTFTSRCPDGVQANSSTLSGKSVQIVAVCDTTATLVVSDGSESSPPADAEIDVTGKLRKVDYLQTKHDQEKKFPFNTDVGTFVFGFNRCAIEWSDKEDPDADDHWLHKPDNGNDVETAQVSDPGGPYDDFFYVTDHNLLVTRQTIINNKLVKGGEVYKDNKDDHLPDIKRIVAATHDHEQIHGDLVEKKLKSKSLKFLDELAGAVDRSEEGLQDRADTIIRGGETELRHASRESKVQDEMAGKWGKKHATILRPDGNKTEKKTYTLAKIGDVEGKGK